MASHVINARRFGLFSNGRLGVTSNWPTSEHIPPTHLKTGRGPPKSCNAFTGWRAADYYTWPLHRGPFGTLPSCVVAPIVAIVLLIRHL